MFGQGVILFSVTNPLHLVKLVLCAVQASVCVTASLIAVMLMNPLLQFKARTTK